MDDARVLEALAAAGFHGHVPVDRRSINAPVYQVKAVPVAQADWGEWRFDAGQARIVTVRARVEGSSTVWSIDVAEWRGGEGYEDEVLRTTNADELLAAITTWTAWAHEPWEPPTGWRARLRAYFGGS